MERLCATLIEERAAEFIKTGHCATLLTAGADPLGLRWWNNRRQPFADLNCKVCASRVTQNPDASFKYSISKSGASTFCTVGVNCYQ